MTTDYRPPDNSWAAATCKTAQSMRDYWAKMQRGAEALADVPHLPEEAVVAWTALALRCRNLVASAQAVIDATLACAAGWHGGLTARELVPREAVDALRGVICPSADAHEAYGYVHAMWALEDQRTAR